MVIAIVCSRAVEPTFLTKSMMYQNILNKISHTHLKAVHAVEIFQLLQGKPEEQLLEGALVRGLPLLPFYALLLLKGI